MESGRTDFPEIIKTRVRGWSIHFWFFESVNRPFSAVEKFL